MIGYDSVITSYSIHYTKLYDGHDKVAQIITFGKLQAKAVVRDVGRVLQMPYGQVDRISKMIPATPGKQITLTEALDTIPRITSYNVCYTKLLRSIMLISYSHQIRQYIA